MVGALLASFLDDPLNDLIDIHPSDFECGATGFDSIQLQHLVESPDQPFCILIDVALIRPDFSHIETLGVLDQFAEALNSDQGGAELMADHREKLSLERVVSLADVEM